MREAHSVFCIEKWRCVSFAQKPIAGEKALGVRGIRRLFHQHGHADPCRLGQLLDANILNTRMSP